MERELVFSIFPYSLSFPFLSFPFLPSTNYTWLLILRPQHEQQTWSFQTNFLQQWQKANVDALLMPVLPWVGYEPKTWVRSSQWLGYTAMWNLLNYAALTMPIGKADGELDRPKAGDEWAKHVPRNESDRFNHGQCELTRFFLWPCRLSNLVQMILIWSRICRFACRLSGGVSVKKRPFLWLRWWIVWCISSASVYIYSLYRKLGYLCPNTN